MLPASTLRILQLVSSVGRPNSEKYSFYMGHRRGMTWQQWSGWLGFYYFHQHWKTWRNSRSLMNSLNIYYRAVLTRFHEGWEWNCSLHRGGRVACACYSIWEVGILVMTNIFSSLCFLSPNPKSINLFTHHLPVERAENPFVLDNIFWIVWYYVAVFPIRFSCFYLLCVIYSVPPTN